MVGKEPGGGVLTRKEAKMVASKEYCGGGRCGEQEAEMCGQERKEARVQEGSGPRPGTRYEVQGRFRRGRDDAPPKQERELRKKSTARAKMRHCQMHVAYAG